MVQQDPESTGSEAELEPRPADSRDMYAVHIMFRREFAALQELVRRVPAGDRARTRIVADHVAFITDLLHVHHSSEDAHCWPIVAARDPQDVAPIVELMELQHLVWNSTVRAIN
jgi:hypothetical protein